MTTPQSAFRVPQSNAPVIVMGMHKSGTTLLAEMVHKGGTPMFAGDLDPRYDQGIKYERPLCQELNRLILGLDRQSRSLEPIWKLPLRPLPVEALSRLKQEVGAGAWGFKDPRTVLTYPMWLEHFPTGPRLYVYRGHHEVMRHYGKKRPWHLLRMRRALQVWLLYNEKMLDNLRLDEAAARPHVLVRYEDLMREKSIVARIEEVSGVRLFDARDPALRRNRVENKAEQFKFRLAAVGLHGRVARLYRELSGRSCKA